MIKVGKKYQQFVHGSGCLCHTPQMRQITERLTDFSRRGFLAGLGAALVASASPGPVFAQSGGSANKVLFRQLRLFDGTSSSIRSGVQVLVEGNRIVSVDTTNSAAPADAVVIDCGDRVLMPGLIDAHWHALFAALPAAVLASADPGYIFAAATAEAERTLLRGFTTVRDLGGPVFSFKQAIDDGLIPGPRIYPSGPMITTSGGHGDLRPLSDLPRTPGRLSSMETMGGSMLADSVAEIQLRTREQLLQGASQLKLMGGGGVASPRAPLDMLTFSEADLRAAVDVARDWNTYVTVHAYAPKTVQRAIAAGAACIEHAHLMDDETARLMADKGVWLSIQPFVGENDAAPLPEPSRSRFMQVIDGTDTAYTLARKYKIKTAFGTDMLFSPEITVRQNTMLTHMTRWYSNLEILQMATSVNADLLTLSGPRNPYPGKLGVIEKGAFADMLVVDGNPMENIGLVEEPEKNLRVIMKDGKVYKNTLSS